MTKFKLPLMFSLIALILSFFTGLINRVPLFTAIIRAFILSIITGAFVFVVIEILKRFVPELFEKAPNTNYRETPDKEQETMGKNININIDDPIDTDINEENIFTESTDYEKSTEYENSQTTGTENSVHKMQENNSDKKTEELDELPNLKEFTPEEEDSDEIQVADFVQEGTGRFDVSTDIDSTDMDAGTMAKAIRTVLKKES